MSAGTLALKRATIADLAREPGKAELIDGRIVRSMATGFRPNKVAGRIYRSLDDHAQAIGRGHAFTDSMGFTVPELLSGRESFSPDASFFDGPPPGNVMKFVEGAPTFAAEVRSENDYGPAAEREMAAKRADYFEAGTTVVWDVDPIAGVIRAYRASSPDRPIIFAAGSTADAEPAMPGWSVAVDWVMA
ncbi:MAG: Uma2 family endonuclease [Gemmataceae bacterium]